MGQKSFCNYFNCTINSKLTRLYRFYLYCAIICHAYAFYADILKITQSFNFYLQLNIFDKDHFLDSFHCINSHSRRPFLKVSKRSFLSKFSCKTLFFGELKFCKEKYFSAKNILSLN